MDISWPIMLFYLFPLSLCFISILEIWKHQSPNKQKLLSPTEITAPEMPRQ